MTSKRRPESEDNGSPTPRKSDKRQRVTCACDPCRIAREKCDGVHPRCTSCINQKRACKYSQTVKKRGVPTGYLKTIELSLAWLIEENPGCQISLQRLLSGGIQSARLLQCLSPEGHQLQKRWSRGSIHESIFKLLSTEVDRSTGFLEDSGAEIKGQDLLLEDEVSTSDVYGDMHTPYSGMTPRLSEIKPVQARTQLPPDWRKLVDTYQKNTHCWFPLANMPEIIHAALVYSDDDNKNGASKAPAVFAELWAVLALGAFQNTSHSFKSTNTPPQQLFSTARNLVPSEIENFEPPHIRAMLLHSLVLIGQGEELAAWLLVGTCTRLSFHLERSASQMNDGEPPDAPQIRAACFVLDTLTSANLGYSGTFNPDVGRILETENALRRWQDSAYSEAMPQRSFNQLFRFCWFLGQHDHETTRSPASISDLVKSLDPSFAFCNNVLSEAEALSPSTFLLQVAFLVTTVLLSSPNGFRVSLATNLIEVVECCTASLGSIGTPPLVVGLLGIFRRSQHFELLQQSEKTRWKVATNCLRVTWAQHIQKSGLVMPLVKGDDCTFTLTMGMQNGLLSPDPSTRCHSECETQGSWQCMSSTLKTHKTCSFQQTQWNPDPTTVLAPPGLDYMDPIDMSLESNRHDEMSSQMMADTMISEDLNTFFCPPELGVDARLIRNLGLDPSELDAL